MADSRVIKNAGWIIGCKIAQSFINLIISMFSARYLGPSNYGLITYAASIVAFVVPIMQLGLSKTLVLDIIERPEREGAVLGTALFMNFISAIACVIAVSGYLFVADADEPTTILVGILYSISLLFQATEILQYWFQAKMLSKYTSVSTIIAYFFVAAYKVYLLVNGKSVVWFAISNSIDYLLVSVILLLIYKKIGSQRLSVSLSLGKEMFSRSKHYIVSVMMVTIFQQTDRIMLKQMLNETETGYYSAAVTCATVSGFVFSAIIDSFRPVILEKKKSGSEDFDKEMKLLYTVITYLSLAQCLVIVFFAKPIVLFLYGEAYIPSVSPLRVAVWFTTFSYYGSVRNIWILAENKQRYLWIINLSGALLNVFLNYLLIPYIGTIGAATASFATQFFTNVIIGYFLNPKPLAMAGRTFFSRLKKSRK